MYASRPSFTHRGRETASETQADGPCVAAPDRGPAVRSMTAKHAGPASTVLSHASSELLPQSPCAVKRS
eukprot:15634-Eustigmatos_ZCMA.PRE.1